MYSRVLAKSPKVLYQNSSVSECRARRERFSRDGKRPVKKGQEKANIKRRWAGDTAISGAGRKKSARLRRLKKELAKRSLRLMCREDGEGLKAPLTCLRFVPRRGAASTLVVPRQDAGRMRRTTVRGDVSLSCPSYLFCVVTVDFREKNRLIVKMECKEVGSTAKKLLFFFFHYIQTCLLNH